MVEVLDNKLEESSHNAKVKKLIGVILNGWKNKNSYGTNVG